MVHCIPVGKQRHRQTRQGVTYTPKKTKDYERLLGLEAVRAFRGVPLPLCGPVEVEVCAVSPRPKRLRRKKDEDMRLRDTRKPDGDNILKSVCDSLVLAGVLTDDACVWRMGVEKWVADKTEPSIVAIRVLWDEILDPTNKEQP